MLFSIPGLVKGTAGTVTLNKAELLALAPVAADEFFSDGENIQLVIAEWNSNPGSQREVAIFKFSDATPSHQFLVSESGQDAFELEQLILVDFDNGELRLDRAALDSAISGGVAQFDVDFTAGGGGGEGGGGEGGGGGGGPLLASSLTWYGDGQPGAVDPIITGTYSTDTLTYSVADGMMTLNYRLAFSSFTGSAGNSAVYGVTIPAGYVMTGTDGTVVGSGTAKSVFHTSGNPLVALSWATGSRLYFQAPGWGGYFGSYSFPRFGIEGFDIEFTATFPVSVA